MCGIAGVSRGPNSTISDDQMKIILAILISRMDDRGGDSWGYYADGLIEKDKGTGTQGIDLEAIASARTLMLHTRHATVGDVTAENAHPWQINNVIGLHNGGVGNHAELNTKYDRNFKVDSQHIFAHYTEDLPLKELRAWGTICFVDTLFDDNVIWAGRFNDGVLTIVGIGKKDETPSDIIFCSTASPLQQALDMAKVPKFYNFAVLEGQLYHITDGILNYSVPNIMLGMNGKTNFSNKREAYDLTIEKPTVYERVTNSFRRHTSTGYSRFHSVAKTPSGLSTAAIKAFVTARSGLEAYYGTIMCSYCETLVANVRVPCTERHYCVKCWAHFEQIVPNFLSRDPDLEMFQTNPQAASYGPAPWNYPPLSPAERLKLSGYGHAIVEVSEELGIDDDNGDEPNMCERCTEELGMWFVPKLDMVLCEACRKINKFGITECVLVTDGPSEKVKEVEKGLTTIQRHLTLVPAVGEPCMLECGHVGTVFYYKEDAKRHLWVCPSCAVTELDKNERPIQLGFSKVSAYNPLRETIH